MARRTKAEALETREQIIDAKKIISLQSPPSTNSNSGSLGDSTQFGIFDTADVPHTDNSHHAAQ